MKNVKSTDLLGSNRTPLSWLISCQIAVLMGFSVPALARDYFNPALLEIGNPAQSGADLSVFEDGEAQAPGKYRVDVYLNGEMLDTEELDFKMHKDAEGKKNLQPCLSEDMLGSMGVRLDLFPLIKASTAAGVCVDLAEAIPMASATLRFDQQRLDISIPQAAISSLARGYVSPEKWDSGIPALLANYHFSGANSKARNSHGGPGSRDDSDTYYLNLRSGFNLGAWRLRNYSTWNRDEKGNNHWDSINTYLQRDIVSLKSQLTLGDSNSPSDIFDSVPFRGAQLASDDDMLPESMRGYSPVVRGIARSNAQVTIKQNGYIIYQSYVPPGAFEIKDLYPTAGSGDLAVTIKEADGSEQYLVVPFASVPVLQREGRFKFSLTSGQYRSYNDDVSKTQFSQATAIYGLPWGATIYGGVQAASKYQSLALGVGQNMGMIGAISADVIQAWTKQEDKLKEDGQSWRLRYGKSFSETGTNFSLASYRYSTAGFYTLQEALESYNSRSTEQYSNHKKSRAEMTLSQNLWKEGGALSLSLIKEVYWSDHRTNESVGVGYNNTWNGISYGLNYSYSKNSGNVNTGTDSNKSFNARDQVFAFNISVPLSRWLPNSYVSYNLNTSRNGDTTNNIGLNGTALENNNLNYGISQAYTSQGQGASGNANADYKGGYGEVRAGYSYDHNQQRLDYGLEGGIILHENGLTLSQPLGETVALVKAPGAGDVDITNNTGVKTDWRGYGVVPYVTAYRRNQVSLDTTTLPDDVDITITSQTVIPTRGAVVRADFNPNIGQRVLMTLLMQGETPVPFGATVSHADSENDNGSIVGDSGQVYLTGMAERGVLNVKWGNAENQQCQVNYDLTNLKANTGIQMVNGDCR